VLDLPHRHVHALTMALVSQVPARSWSMGPMSSTRIMQADTQ